MNKNYTGVIAYGLIFLFFIQMAGVLVESIYILDLMNTSLDAKVLGLLFFFSPALLFPFPGKLPSWLVLLGVGALIICRGSLPYLETSGRLFAAGIGVAALLLLLPHLLTARIKTETNSSPGWLVAAGLSAAICLSVYLRTLNFGVDYSLTQAGGWIGGLLGLALAWALTNPDWQPAPAAGGSSKGVTPALLGMFLILTLVYFAFSAPSVIARWVDGNYTLVVLVISLQAAAWTMLMLVRPDLPMRVSRGWLLCWNLAFTLAITATCLAQHIAFPLNPQAAAVVSSSPGWLQMAPLYLMLLTFPVILLDFQLFFNQISQSEPAPRQLLPGILLGCLALLALAFASIFSNVWGYIDPVSTPFRNMFWLPYFLTAAGIGVIGWFLHGKAERFSTDLADKAIFTPGIFMAAMVIGSVVSAVQSGPIQSGDPNKHSLVVMTYNIQEANDGYAQRSLDRQLAVIERVSPDILALQESDSARISLNNDDIVRYFAGKLGYYSYYGPSTITGTFGTAILSKYPLQNVRSAFSYSDVDEIGSAEAELEVAGQRFTIYNVHPDGSEAAKLALTRSLLERSEGKTRVIILGDFNMRDTDKGYAQVAANYTNAWVSIYPSKISADGVDMSGSNRIDHIFLSHDLSATSATYLLPPASASDHPVHWAEITWQK